MNKHFVTAIFVARALAWTHTSIVQAEQTPPTNEQAVSSPIEQWWNGKYASGNWFGLRDTLNDEGVILGASWRANFLGVVSGGIKQRAGFDEELKFFGSVDFAKLIGWEPLEGLTARAEVRWRDGDGVNKYAGTIGSFNPSTYQGQKQWRFMTAYLTYTTPELFGIKDFLTLSGGWQPPSDFFIVQPESKFFVNNTFLSSRGIATNGILWSGSYSTWGGYMKIKPNDWYYLTSGLWLAAPFGTETRNHGLYFAGYQVDPSLNGLYWVTETGFTPKIGSSKLPGRYAAGFIYWGVENSSFSGENVDQRLQFYWQADQMLYREPLPAEETPSEGKALSSKPKLGDQGLYFFSLIDFAPPYNSLLPFYFQTGMIYKGLIPSRDEDQLGIALAYGNFSFDNIKAQQQKGDVNQQNYTAVLEIDYRIQVNKWAYVQPLVQYIVHPNGSERYGNATVVGLHFGMNF
jgi:porin